jgi:hypothetical protein
MIDDFSQAQIIGALIAVLVASYAAFFGWLVAGIHRLDRKIDTKVDALDAKLSTRIDAVENKLSARIDAVDTKLSAKLDALTIAVSRLEGAVYHGLPEPRRAVSEQ